MKIVTFLLKNGGTAKRVVDFPLERDTFRNKIMEIVEDFDEKKSYNNNGKPWKSYWILRLSPFFHFSFFFYHFSTFFHFLTCSFMFFHFFVHFLSFFRSFSFIFFHVLLFSFIFFFFVGCSKSFFLGLNSVTISFDSSYVKNQFLGPSRVRTPLGPLFLFFLLFFLPVFCLFSCFLFFHFFSFFVHIFIFFLSFFFFHFSEEKVSSFLFSCVYFNIFYCWR